MLAHQQTFQTKKIKTYGKRGFRTILVPALASAPDNLKIATKSSPPSSSSFTEKPSVDDFEVVISPQIRRSINKERKPRRIIVSSPASTPGQLSNQVSAFIATAVASPILPRKEDCFPEEEPLGISTPLFQAHLQDRFDTFTINDENEDLVNEASTLLRHEESSSSFKKTPLVSRLASLLVSPFRKTTAINEYEEEEEISALESRLSEFTIESSRKSSSSTNSIDALLGLCDQSFVLDFSTFVHQSEIARKLNEATFCEVFISKDEDVVFKIIPFDDSIEKFTSDQDQTSAQDIYQEVLITKLLSELDASFVEYKGAAVVKGKYPSTLLEMWDQWALDEGNDCQNDRPEYFKLDQKFLVLMLGNGGIPLENIELEHVDDAMDILYHVSESLAKAEKLYEFEHRDLHWGNILIDVDNDLKCTIIDYTFSRLYHNNQIYYRPFETEDYFTGEGDYQFDIYRMMRNCVKSNWSTSCTRTNILWLHYLADKLLEQVLPQRIKGRRKLMDMRDRLLTYDSIQEFIESEAVFLNSSTR